MCCAVETIPEIPDPLLNVKHTLCTPIGLTRYKNE